MAQRHEEPGGGDAVDGRPAGDHETDKAAVSQRDEGANQEKMGSKANFRADDGGPDARDAGGLSDG